MDDPCRNLRRLVEQGPTPLNTAFYHRYLHGQVPILRFLLPDFDLKTIRTIYKSVLSILLLFGIALSFLFLAHTRRPVFAFFIIAFFGLSRWFGIGLFGQSVGHAPSDLVLPLYLLTLCVGVWRGMGRTGLVLSAALAGALTMIFELLTGGLPLGAAMVVGATAMVAPAKDGQARDILDSVVASLVAFVASAALMLALKIAAATIVSGTAVLSDFSGRFVSRTLGQETTEAFPNGGFLDLVREIRGGLGGLAEQSHVLAAGMLGIAFVAGIWGLWTMSQHANKPAARLRLTLLALSVVPVLLWFIVFWQHSVQHAWFTGRILVWIIIAGLSIFFCALWHQRGLAPRSL